MNAGLAKYFSASKVKEAMFNMKPLESFGSNGFLYAFYQNHWEIVRPRACAAILEALNDGIWFENLNDTHIALIPKTKSPYKVTEFRPISFCNVFTKSLLKCWPIC